MNITIITTISRVSRAVLGGPGLPHSAGKKGHTELLQNCKNHQTVTFWKLPQGTEKSKGVCKSHLPITGVEVQTLVPTASWSVAKKNTTWSSARGNNAPLARGKDRASQLQQWSTAPHSLGVSPASQHEPLPCMRRRKKDPFPSPRETDIAAGWPGAV